MGKVLTLILSLGIAFSANAKSLNISDISEVYLNDATKNLLIVRDKNGKLLRLKVTPARREAIVKALGDANSEEILEVTETTKSEKKTIVKEAATARTTTETSKAATTTAAPAAAKTTTTAEAVTEKKSPWSASLLTISGMTANNLANLKGSISNYVQVGFYYKFNDKWKAGIIPNVGINYSLDQGNTKHSLGNLPLELNRGKIAELAGFGITTKARFYLPTGEGFRKAGTNGQARLYLGASKKLNDLFSLSAYNQIRYNLQSNRSIAQFDEFGRVLTTPKATSSFQGLLGADVSLKITKGLSLTQSTSVFHSMKYDDPELGLVDPPATTILSQGLSLGISYFSAVYISLGVSQDFNMSSNVDNSFALYNPDETGYSLLMSIPL